MINNIDSKKIDRELIEQLFSRKMISPEAKQSSLELLYLPRNWPLWISRFLLVIGISFILVGIIFFFAINWEKFSTLMKFSIIQSGIAINLCIAYIFGFNQLKSKLLLLGASILIGVFLSVFGEVYKTAAYEYRFFLMWGTLILPWALIAKSAPLWGLFTLLLNICCREYWLEVKSLSPYTINVYVILLNIIFLAIREICAKKAMQGLNVLWTRHVLVFYILFHSILLV